MPSIDLFDNILQTVKSNKKTDTTLNSWLAICLLANPVVGSENQLTMQFQCYPSQCQRKVSVSDSVLWIYLHAAEFHQTKELNAK